MNNDLLHRIALTRVPHIGDVQARILIQQLGEASAVFKTPMRQLEKIEGIGTVRAGSIKSFNNFASCEKEIRFIEQHDVSALFFTDKEYPRRLLHCHDAPVMLYARGKADLNPSLSIAIVGTRHNDDYGKQLCEELVAGLINHPVCIISGLAFGIDTIAHRASLKNNLPTLGVLAHGLDRIYPWQNRFIAEQMLTNGALLTDFPCDTLPDKQNFPRRNRIVAGMCDCLVVIQSAASGGSLITASLANGYHRDVFAFPGRAHDEKAAGCLHLIRDHQAELITSATDLLIKMNWSSESKKEIPFQADLFPELSGNEKIICELLKEKEMHADELLLNSTFSNSLLASVLLTLEMKSLVISLPGKRYRLRLGIGQMPY